MSQVNVGKITLDLTGRVDVPKIEGGEFSNFIQQEAFHRLRTILKIQLEDAKISSSEHSSGIVRDRSHNAIAILGGRGSGKTTFMLNALDLLSAEGIQNPSKNESDADAQAFAKSFSRVEILNVIDPTLIEHKEHILITILSSIKGVVDKRHRERQRAGKSDDESYATVSGTLKAVGEGLPALKEIGSNGLVAEAWDNPQYVLQEGLKRARTGTGLETALKNFIAEALKYIGRDVFILPLDDIDTSFERGWPVLEVLRKYLTTPKLIVVLSGDFTLYSLLVRDQQWKLLKDLNKIEGGKTAPDRHAELVREVSRLESQYLQKIIKPGNRIELLPLSFFWESKVRRNDFQIKFNKRSDPVSLELAMTILTRSTLYSDKQDDLHRLAMLILRQPTRTVIHLLRALEASDLVAAQPVQGTLASAVAASERFDEPLGLREFHATMAETFLTELQSVGLMADRVNLAPTENFLNEVHTFLSRNNFWEEGYSLALAFRDDAASLASLCLGARLGREMRTSPGLIFKYLIMVCGTRDVKIGLPIDPQIGDLMSYLALDRQELVGITASRMIGAIRSEVNKVDRRATLRGTVAVYYLRRNKRSDKVLVGVHEHFGYKEEMSATEYFKENQYLSDYFESLKNEKEILEKIIEKEQIGFLFNTWSSLEKRLSVSDSGRLLLNVVSVVIVDNSGLKSSFLSILPLIGCLGDLLNRTKSLELLDAMGSNLRSYRALYGASEALGNDQVEDDENSGGADEEDIKPTDLAELLDTWSNYAISELEKIGPLPPFVLARIWQRFQDSLAKIDDDIPNSERYAGWLLHRQIVVFLNSVLVEESRFREAASTMTLSNPVRTDRHFLLNLKRRQEQKQRSIFDVIFSCPLWSLYLSPDSKSVKFDKGEGEAPVFVQHLESTKIFSSPEAVKNAISISYRAGKGKGNTHRFTNMYYVLNSLLVMGRAPWNSTKKPGDLKQRDIVDDEGGDGATASAEGKSSAPEAPAGDEGTAP